MDTDAWAVISTARTIILVLPENPRLDQVAAGVSLASALDRSGKPTTVVCPSPMTAGFSRIVGMEKVADAIGQKNLTIRFVDYDAQGIDTVTYDVPNGRFELLVTTKEGFTPPAQSQIQASYSGVVADVVIFVGFANLGLLGKLQAAGIEKGKNLVFLGTNEPSGNLNFVAKISDNAASSISEVVVHFLKTQNLPIDQDLASNLLFGIESATNNFLSGSVSAETFEAAAACLRLGAIRHARQMPAHDNRPWKQRGGPSSETHKAPSVPGRAEPTQTSVPAPAPTPQPAPQVESQTPIPETTQPTTPATQSGTKSEPPTPEWLEPKIYTGRTVV